MISVQVSFRKILLGSLDRGDVRHARRRRDQGRRRRLSPSCSRSRRRRRSCRTACDAEFGPRLQQLVAQEQALKARNDKYQKDLATMAADQRTKAEKDLRDSAREIERKKAELQDDSNAKRQEEMNKLQRLLFGEVREYAKAQNFDIVIAEGVHLRHAHGRHHRCGAGTCCRRVRRSRPQARPRRRPRSRPRSPEARPARAQARRPP